MLAYLIWAFVILLSGPNLAQAEKLERLNPYGPSLSGLPVLGLKQPIEKHWLSQFTSTQDLLEEILRGTGLSLVVGEDPDLNLRLKQSPPLLGSGVQGNLINILQLIMEGYQLIYDPIHAYLSFRPRHYFNRRFEVMV